MRERELRPRACVECWHIMFDGRYRVLAHWCRRLARFVDAYLDPCLHFQTRIVYPGDPGGEVRDARRR